MRDFLPPFPVGEEGKGMRARSSQLTNDVCLLLDEAEHAG